MIIIAMSPLTVLPMTISIFLQMVTCKLNERHRFLLLEINECYETYVMRQDQAIDSLEQIRSMSKLTSPGNSPNETSGTEQVPVE